MQRRRFLRVAVAGAGAVALGQLGFLACCGPAVPDEVEREPEIEADEDHLRLPEPWLDGQVSVEKALSGRRSVRDYAETSLSLPQIGQLLWAAQGVTASQGFRAAPSAGALYPLQLHLVAGEVEGLAAGVYTYLPEGHLLGLVSAGDLRPELARAASSQSFVARAGAVLVVSAVYARTTGKYGERGIRYVHMEAGHAAQNIYLEAEALGLGTVAVGAFADNRVSELLRMAGDEQPLYLMPVGRPAG